MKKKTFKRLATILLAMVCLCGCITVSAETTYTYVDISKNEETTVKVWTGSYTSEMSGATAASAGGETFAQFNYGNYVVFRVNVLAAGLYDLSIGFGTSVEGNKAFSVTVDDGDAMSVSPLYSGSGEYVAEYMEAGEITLSKGQHEIKLTSTGASGSLMGIKLKLLEAELTEIPEGTTYYPNIVLEAEDFTEAGYYSTVTGDTGNKVDETKITTGETADGTKYVELDNWDYIRIPYTISKAANYRFYIIYSATSGASLSVAGKFDASVAATSNMEEGDLETFKVYDFGKIITYSAHSSTAYIRPHAMVTDGKIRIDKIVLTKEYTSVPTDGSVMVKKFKDYDEAYTKLDAIGVVGNPIGMYGSYWTEHYLNFTESGYYDVQMYIDTTYATPSFTFSIDGTPVNTNVVPNCTGTGFADNTFASDAGTYYIEAGTRVFKVLDNGGYCRLFDFTVQKVDVTDGTEIHAADSDSYSANVIPDAETDIAAGEYITFKTEITESGYYNLKGMFSTATDPASITITAGGKEYSADVSGTGTSKYIKLNDLCDVYFEEGEQTITIAVGEDGATAKIHSIRIYKPVVTYEGVEEGISQAQVKLNGLFNGKEADVIIAVYKEKNGIKELYKVNYGNAQTVQNGTDFELGLTDVEFEEGYTYTAKILIWNNMRGNCYEYAVK